MCYIRVYNPLRFFIQVGKYSKEVGSLNDKLCHAEDLLEPMEMVKKRIQQSLLTAQSQLELKTTELEQCKMYVQVCEEQVTNNIESNHRC